MKRDGSFILILFTRFLISNQSNSQINKLNQIENPLNVPCSTPICEGPLSNIYCHGPILSSAWQFGMQRICPADKMKYPAESIISNFKKLTYPITRKQFEIFCEENFEVAAFLKTANLPDWVPDPKFLQNISNYEMRQLAAEIHKKWIRLAREFDADVFRNPELYPVRPVRNPFIVPGGRFEVYYYWDTYWILKGLLVSNMIDTAEGIINNFKDLIENYGFIPNSGNIQLSRRSQPPLFIQMVWDYSQKTGSYKKEWLSAMSQEVKFWENNRTITISGQILFIYKTITNCPRPENFLSDYQVGINQSDPKHVWKSITSACESGWDFSSRWMKQDEKRLYTLHADQIIPVDLNVFMAMNYYVLRKYYDFFSEFSTSEYYHKKYVQLIKAIDQVLWDEKQGIWLDYDLIEQKRNFNFYPSNVFPLLIAELGNRADRVADYMKKSGSLDFKGGIPATLPVQSSEQWDFPNVWAPNQHLLIKSFLQTNNTFLNEQAKIQAYKFIQVVFNGLFITDKENQGAIWEKYDARSISGSPGGGGEYVVQEGFGWTNGAILDLIWLLRENELPRSDRMFGTVFQKIFIISSWIFSSLLVLLFILRGCCCQRFYGSERRSESLSLLVDTDDDSDTV